MVFSGRVLSLHRYPVKSMVGEDVERLELDARGGVGDRVWSVQTAAGNIGSGKNTRRFEAVPGLLRLRASRSPDGVLVTFPDGRVVAIDDPDADRCLSEYLGQPLHFTQESDVSHFDDGPVSIIGSASVARAEAEVGGPVAAARFRPNIILETHQPFVEDEWLGRLVKVGSADVRISELSPRCVMVNAQTADLPELPGTLAAIGRINNARLGVVATVVEPGAIEVGDTLVVR